MSLTATSTAKSRATGGPQPPRHPFRHLFRQSPPRTTMTTFQLRPLPDRLARNPVSLAVQRWHLRRACTDLRIGVYLFADRSEQRAPLAEAALLLDVGGALCEPQSDSLGVIEAGRRAVRAMLTDGGRWRSADAGAIDEAASVAMSRIVAATAAELARASARVHRILGSAP